MKTFSNAARPEPKREIPCAVCGGSSFEPLWELAGFSFRTCSGCGLIQQNPQPERSSVIGRYSGEYLEYELANENAFRDLELKALSDVGFAAESARSVDFLDVGCATGSLIARLKEGGARARGVEPCPQTAGYAREKRGLDVFTGTLEEARLPDASLDVIHASHVIEHMNDPTGFVDEARRLLRDAGILILTTPNSDGFQAGVFGPAWRSVINDHLYLFSYKTLKRLLESRGFRVTAHKTWGGWAKGAKPAFLKAPLDRLAKALGLGDVMVLKAEKAGA
jgi:SAM-dependent methyltransferase